MNNNHILFFIIPRKVDIADFIKEQEDLKKKIKR